MLSKEILVLPSALPPFQKSFAPLLASRASHSLITSFLSPEMIELCKEFALFLGHINRASKTRESFSSKVDLRREATFNHELIMKFYFQLLSLIALSVELTNSKVYSACDFVEEIFATHKVPREDIYKHLCIAETLHTAHNSGHGFIGIYRVGHEWWCGRDQPGGGCNVTCANLLDNDIADDVACASLILSQQKLTAWGKSESSCRASYGEKATQCLAGFDVEDLLNDSSMWGWEDSEESLTELPRTTTSTSTSTTTLRTITSSTTPPKTTTMKPRSTTTTRLPMSTSTPSYRQEELSSQADSSVQEKSSSFTYYFLLFLSFLVITAAVAFIWFKYQQQRIRESQGTEFTNSLIA